MTARPGLKFVWGLRVLVLFCLFLTLSSMAQTPPTEYQIKAAFLYNFAKFVKWPPQSFPETNSPIVVGVLGKNVFGADLEKTIHDKTVNNRPFKFVEFKSSVEATNCHILFISPSEKDNLKKIVDGLNNSSILTVSETDQFIRVGGMVNFYIQENKIRFEINDEMAKKAGLTVSSKLLGLSSPQPR